MKQYKHLVLLLFCVLCCGVFTGQAQSKKKIKKFNIQSTVVTEQIGSRTFTVSQSVYTSNGLLSEQYDYDKNGVLETVNKYAYDAKGNRVMERKFNGQNQLLEMKTAKYNAVEQKMEELTFDGQFKMKKREVFSYYANGLKKEKRIYNASNTLISVKKYRYDMDEDHRMN